MSRLSIFLVFTDNNSTQLVEQLQVYYTKWKSNLHVKEALSLSSTARKPLAQLIYDPRRSENAPPVPEQPLNTRTVTRGLLPIVARSHVAHPAACTASASTTAPIPTPGPHCNTHQTSCMELGASLATVPWRQQPVLQANDISRSCAESPAMHSPSMVPNVPTISHPRSPAQPSPSALYHTYRGNIELLSRQRVKDALVRSKPVKQSRKSRTCRKCALPTCSGRQKVSNCKNKCRDCEEVGCKGRNPKRLDKSCADGWDAVNQMLITSM